jgi:hypothetical protein
MPIIAGRASAAYGAGFSRAVTAAVPLVGSFDALGTVTVPSGGLSSITFAGIPQTGYSHLQVRAIARSTAAQNFYGPRMRVGSSTIDSGSNYALHQLYGTGSAAAASAGVSNTEMYATTGPAANDTANSFGVIVVDILDYANTNKYKTARFLGGTDLNGSGYIHLNSGLWMNTSAISQIQFFPSGGNFAEYSQFALYGVKA